MAALWSWSSLPSNPFVDFSTRFIEPLIQQAVDVTHRVEPDLLCVVAYIGVIGTAYLFHSPFRAHSTAATDTYGRVTKVFQTWSMIVFFGFHLGPQFFRTKQSQIEQARNGDDTAVILFFPLFIAFNMWFALLHKVKRRWQLGLTYGGRFSVIGLNSLVLAAVGTAHYAYCSTLYENASHWLIKALLYSLTPPSVTERPFRCIASVLLLSACFVAADYQYKKWHGFDPARGILWSELYKLRKPPRDVTLSTEKSADADKQDWRELVAPPRVYARAALPTASFARAPLPASGLSAISSLSPPYKVGPPTLGVALSSRPGKGADAAGGAATATSAFPAPPPLRPRVLYHECPPDVDMDLVESWFDVDDAALRRVCGEREGSPAPQPPPPSASPAASPSSSAGVSWRASGAERAMTHLMSFRAPRFFVDEVQEAQHPVNRPGMVPWWSTFVLFTAWQTLAGATLRFLAFDVRTIQGFTTPKILHLHFTSSLRRAVGAADACLRSQRGWGTPPPAPSAAPMELHHAGVEAPLVGQSTTISGAVADGGAAGGSAPQSPRGAAQRTGDGDEDGGGGGGGGVAVEAESDAPDVWFDWIADVGDGFNPTYTLARLLAQPSLHLPMTAAKRTRRTRRGSHGAAARSGDTSLAASMGASLMAQAAASAPTTPNQLPPRSASAYRTSLSPFSVNSVGSYDTERGEEAEANDEEGEDAEGLRYRSRSWRSHSSSSAAPSQSPPQQLLSGVVQPTTASPVATDAVGAGELSDAAEARDGSREGREYPLRSREAVSASYNVRPPRRHTAVLGAIADPRTAASRALLDVEKNGFATLPRGSFVVIGGDLAYPSPDDDTYTTRLFEPYGDALGGNVRLQNLFHTEQQRVVVADPTDADVAHIHMLDAKTVSEMAKGRGGIRQGRSTAEEALRSLPLLFAIPGNHDWFDGLTTFRKFVLERTWIGGWLMPQKSSFFVLRLPYNWFMLCGDTGNTQDIDVSQRNYFLDVIERYMDVESCVILAAHEPGWLFDAMEREEKPRQPELDRVVEALGTRLRLRLAGDIHHYSRHIPTDPSSEAATLVVSGGGGAFLHGSRNDRIISQGTKYVRASAFPSRTTFTNMASRLWGFRVVNWKFDMVVGFLCFVILLSVLPLPMETEMRGAAGKGIVAGSVSLAQIFSLWVGYATGILSHVVTRGVISAFPILFFWACFSSAGSDRHASLSWRLGYGAAWTFLVVLCCSCAMAFIHVQILYLMDNGFLYSAEGKWNSVMERQAEVIVATFLTHAQQMLVGGAPSLELTRAALRRLIDHALPLRWLLVCLRCLDPFETLGYLSVKVSGGAMGVFDDSVSRLQVLIYYSYVLFFYWIVITPIVSMLIGTFLLTSVSWFDYMYDGTFSAFQIEDYKHFIRFRIDASTRQLHAYVVAVQKPAKVYQLDRSYLWSLVGRGLEEHRPPHLKQFPSRWAPVQNEKRRKASMAEVLEHFTVHPHRVP